MCVRLIGEVVLIKFLLRSKFKLECRVFMLLAFELKVQLKRYFSGLF